MPLTPSTVDPNRKKELARKKTDPGSFGPDNVRAVPLNPLPKDWKPSQLRTGKK